jgi:xanthine dehydrogenase YagS FAD-binding subunit
MKPFKIVRAKSITDINKVFDAAPRSSYLLAGGIDLMDEIKEGLITPDFLVDIMNMKELKVVRDEQDGLRVGALSTLESLESNSLISTRYPALAQSVASVGTPQIRNVATIGGNLCQRPRCWYYRNKFFDCLKKGGKTCFAVDGQSKYHAVFGGHRCYIVHPSDPAIALISYRAQVDILSVDGIRRQPLTELYVGPGEDILRETRLRSGDTIKTIIVPPIVPGQRSVFLKATERRTQDFALVSVALVITVDHGFITDARLTLGGVAPTPYMVSHVEDEMRGSRIMDLDYIKMGKLAAQGASPLKHNSYKIGLVSSLVETAIRDLAYS